MRIVYLCAGLICVGVGGIGVVVPGLPTVGPFILAAWFFSKSSKRLENWILDLPGIGPMVTDYRSGLGMPRRAKFFAIGSMSLAVLLSITLAIDNLPIRVLVGVLGLIGVWYVGFRVPTRETVLAERGLDPTGR